MTRKSAEQQGIAIIMILIICLIIFLGTTLWLYYYQQKKSFERDQVRIDDLNEITRALEAYRNKYGQYPEGEAVSIDLGWKSGNYDELGSPLALLVEEGLLDALPTDPINKNTGCNCGSGYFYYYCYYDDQHDDEGCVRGFQNGSISGKYHLSVCIENTQNSCGQTCSGISSYAGNYCQPNNKK